MSLSHCCVTCKKCQNAPFLAFSQTLLSERVFQRESGKGNCVRDWLAATWMVSYHMHQPELYKHMSNFLCACIHQIWMDVSGATDQAQAQPELYKYLLLVCILSRSSLFEAVVLLWYRLRDIHRITAARKPWQNFWNRQLLAQTFEDEVALEQIEKGMVFKIFAMQVEMHRLAHALHNSIPL